MSAQGFTVWVTGPDARAVGNVVAELTRRLAAREMTVETIDVGTPGVQGLDVDASGRAAALAAGLLARHGIACVIALPGSRAARDRARADVGRMIEVHVPGEGLGYEAPERPEVEIGAADAASGSGIERTLRTLEVLGLLPRDDAPYSEEDEREVIKRLKAFGYL